jgi:hypothetical protein
VTERGLLVLLASCALLTSLAGCSADVPASIGSARYHSVGLTGDAALAGDLRIAPVMVRLSQANGELDLIATGPLNTSTVPISLDGPVLVPAKNGARTSLVGCAKKSPECTVDGWLSSFVSKRLTYTSSGETLLLTAGSISLALRRD